MTVALKAGVAKDTSSGMNPKYKGLAAIGLDAIIPFEK